MKDLIRVITPWIAVICAVVAGFFAYRTQLRVKAFELLLDRRSEVLTAIEERIEFYRKVLIEIEANSEEGSNLERFKRTHIHEPLILYHRARGVALGPLADFLIQGYWEVSTEIFMGTTKEELKHNITRRINSLAVFYGFSHRKISAEIESIATSPFRKVLRFVGIGEKLKKMNVEESSDTKILKDAELRGEDSD